MSVYSDINNKKYSKKRTLIIFIWFGLCSIIIGTVFLGLACPACLLKPKIIIDNVGYSLLLGYSLFGFGFVFSMLERNYIHWIQHPIKSLFIILSTSTFYCSLAIFGVNGLWHLVFHGGSFSSMISNYGHVMWIEFGIFYFIALWFYTRSFFMEWRKEVENREKLKHEALMLQYESLKTQVNPHFLFNSLNALTTLIETDVNSAKKFTSELSCFYRDILQLKNKELISVQEEINIVKRYIYLQKIRFGDNFSYQLPNIDEKEKMVIPLSLQMMVENVFKHNIVTSSKKVKLRIEINAEELIISNTYHPKKNSSNSGLGLKNLNERTKYLTGKEIHIVKSPTTFVVHLPLIVLNHAHNNC